MIKKPNNWENVSASASGYTKENLPAGGYEARIIQSSLVQNKDGSQSLVLLVDVTAGEYAGFFKRDYDTNPYENKRWRGSYRQKLPNDNDKSASYFKGMITAIEKSNKGYTWNWDESTLKGKNVGILVRGKEYLFNGKHGFTNDIFALVDLDVIRSGNYKKPEPKMLSENQSQFAPYADNTMAADPIQGQANTTSDDNYPF